MSDGTTWEDPRDDVFTAVEEAFANRRARDLTPAVNEPGSGGELPANEAVPAPTAGGSEPAPEPVGDGVVAPPDPAVIEPDPTTEPPGPSEFSVLDRTFDEETARQLLGVYDWATSLDPSTAAAITQLTSGDYYLVPREVAQAQQAQITTQAPQPQEPPDPLAALDPDEVDPQVLAILRAQQEQIQQLMGQTQQSQMLAQTAVQRDWEMAADSAITRYRSAHDYLSDDDMRALGDVIQRNNVLDALSAQYSNLEDLYTAALDWATHAVPEIRERDVQARIDARARELRDAEAATSAAIQDKVAMNQAANTSTGSVPRSDPPPTGMSKTARLSAMAAEIAASTTGP